MTDLDHASEDPAGAPTLDNRKKILLLAGVAVLLLGFGGLYLAWASSRASDDLADREERAREAVQAFEATQPKATPAPTVEPTPAVIVAGVHPAPGEVLVVNRVPGDDYGRLAIRHADGTRTLLDRSCLRVHLAAHRGVCLSQDEGVVPQYTTTFFESTNPEIEVKSYPSALPSRARISPSGRFSSVTAFVTGTSYADISTETTTIVTVDEIDGNRLLRGINNFTVDSDDDAYASLNPQYWGMTFAPDEDTFFITGYFGSQPEILSGSLETSSLLPTGWVGSCPSLSPDGTTLVFKEMRDDGGFDLVAYDLATDKKWQLGETRSVDDQVEWLDDDTILYALHPEGGDTPVQPEFDIWMLDIAEGSEPVLFLPNADSPAVAR